MTIPGISAPVLLGEHLSFGYPDRPLFQDWSVAVPAGVTWVTGGDGSGKSTLLKLLAGELACGGGLSIRGTRLDVHPAHYRRQVAWCDPRTDAFEQVTPLAYFESLRRDRPGFDSASLDRHIEGFGLEPHLAKPMYQLSTGSRRKVWLSGSLASSAVVTLLDEPRAALDGPSIAHLMRALQEASTHTSRAWIVADYELPGGAGAPGGHDTAQAVPLASVIELPD